MYLIINLGLKSIRFIVFDRTGHVVYSNSLPVHTSLRGKHIEQDANEWKNLFYALFDELSNKTTLLSKIDFITSTTSSSCVFGYNKSFEPVTKVLMVSDTRSSDEVKEILQSPKYLELKREENLLVSTSSNIPKLLWFRNNNEEIFNKIEKWVGAGEFINYELTGEIFTDPLNASKSFYSEFKKGYPNELFSELSISTKILPPVYKIGSQFDIKKSIKDKYRLNPNCKYILTTYDAICAVIGSSNGEEGNVCDVSGTITSVRAITSLNTKIKDKKSTILKQNISPIKKSIIGSSNNMGGGIIEWYKQAFYSETDDAYGQIDMEANLSSVGAKGIIFIPYLLGERSPIVNANIRAAFLGVDRNTTKNDFSRAVFESAAYVTNDLLQLIWNETGNIKSLSVSGGLARSDTVNQIKADVTNLPVYVTSNFESTSIGALMLLRLAIKEFSSLSEAKKIISFRKIIIPNKNSVEIYREFFALYKKIVTSLEELSISHSKLRKKLESYSINTLKNL